MSMIKCLECGKRISDKAQVCVNCGAPLEEASSGNAETKNTKRTEKQIPRFPAVFMAAIAIIILRVSSLEDKIYLGIFLGLLLLEFARQCWINSFRNKDKLSRRNFFSLSDFFSVPSARENRKKNILIFSIIAPILLFIAIGAVFSPDQSDFDEEPNVVNLAFAHKLTVAITPIAKIENILKTHPWLCLSPNEKEICGSVMFVMESPTGDYRIENFTALELDGDKVQLQESSIVAASEEGLCEDLDDKRTTIRVHSDNSERVSRIKNQLHSIKQAFLRAGVRTTCSLFFDVTFNKESGIHIGKAAVAVKDTEMTTTPEVVHFLSQNPFSK